MYIILNRNGTYFFADTTVNVDPSADDLVEIIGMTAHGVRFFDSEHEWQFFLTRTSALVREQPQKKFKKQLPWQREIPQYSN